MSTIIGGPHKCNIHPDFPETDNTEEFNIHIAESGHTISGAIPCEVCGTEIRVENIPIQQSGKTPKIKCEKCYNDSEDLNRMLYSSNSGNQNE